MADTPHGPMDAITDSLKRASAALREAGVPALLGGGLAAWARGGPESLHDLDFMVKPEDAERALEALADAGMRTERPPEGWLYKAWDGEVCIDLIFEPRGLPVTDAVIERGDEVQVKAIPVRVMALEDVLAPKLLALDEHSLDYEGLLQMARALREQVNWGEVRDRTAESPFARAFFVMLTGLGVVEEPRATAPRGNVRVISDAG
jgi:hypothetical protein